MHEEILMSKNITGFDKRQGDIEGIERVEGRTEVIVDEGGNVVRKMLHLNVEILYFYSLLYSLRIVMHVIKLIKKKTLSIYSTHVLVPWNR
jgi:hypothetical protein